jgi:hypothetical protein
VADALGKAYKAKRVRKNNVIIPYTSRDKWF